MPSLPVLVVSCDRYADLWGPFFELFWRQWPDCPGPVYLGSNFERYADPRVETLAIGADVTWADGVARMLDRIPSDYVLLMLEDFLLMQPVDTARVLGLAGIARAEQTGCLRLYSIYPPERDLPEYPALAAFAPGDKYRITAQAAIWRMDTLRRLLVPGFSAWDFELLGSQMSDFMPDRIWGVREPALVYDHAVEKGRWRPQGLAICRAADVPVDLDRRGAFTETELARHEQLGLDSARLAERKTRALEHFKRAERAAGLRDLSWCLGRRPWSIQLWAIGVMGMAGPRAIRWLHRLHIRNRVAKAAAAYDRALRAQSPATR
jgi:hypothetical protein